MGDSSHSHNTTNESAYEAEIDEGHEQRVVPCPEITNHREDLPREGEHRYYEQHQDEVRCEQVDLNVLVHEPGQHADYGDCDDDFEDPP